MKSNFKHITVLALLFTISSTMLLIMGISISVGLPIITTLLSDGNLNSMFTLITRYVGGVMLFFSIPGYLCAYGLFNQKSWSRIFAMILSIISLFSIPIGTCIGVYGLYVLMQDDVIELFENKKK